MITFLKEPACTFCVRDNAPTEPPSTSRFFYIPQIRNLTELKMLKCGLCIKNAFSLPHSACSNSSLLHTGYPLLTFQLINP